MATLSLHTFKRAALVVTLAVASVAAVAQDFKVGYVNTDRVLREANVAKASQTKLEQEFSKREKDLQALANQIKTASERFEREAPTLPESQRVARQRQLVSQDQELQRKQREFQEDLNMRKNEELQQVLERANRVIQQIAESEKFDLIIQEVVYVHPRHNITEKVINGLNAAR
jgi:outer membrane protein